MEHQGAAQLTDKEPAHAATAATNSRFVADTKWGERRPDNHNRLEDDVALQHRHDPHRDHLRRKSNALLVAARHRLLGRVSLYIAYP